MKEFTMIVTVAGEPDESCISIEKVSEVDIEVLQPLLDDIRNHRGFYPTGRKWIAKAGLSAKDLYHNHVGWDVWESIIPRPVSGFSTILSVHLFDSEPWKMDML